MSKSVQEKQTIQHKILKSITFKYVLAISLLAAFSIIAFVLNQSQSYKLKEDYKTINLSGRQRMLSQRIALLAGRNDRPGLIMSMKEFKDGLLFLQSTRFLNGQYPEITELYHGPQNILEIAKDLDDLATGHFSKDGFHEKIYGLSQKLLQKFDQATLLKQQISEREHDQRFKIEIFIFFSTLLILILEVIFIFTPMAKEVSSTFLKLNDIEEKSLQNARLATIGETASMVGHEISNPLMAISFTTATILNKAAQSLDPSLIQKLNIITKNANKISTILGALKAQARESSQDSPKSSSLVSIIKEALELLEFKFKQHNIKLTFDENKIVEVVCRPSAITQVLINLISNAIDAVSETVDEKQIKIEIITEQNQTIVRIQDSGNGVPYDMEDAIFESFITTKKEGHGTGLGLAISKKIMQEHGGELRLNTSISRSCFELVFPS